MALHDDRTIIREALEAALNAHPATAPYPAASLPAQSAQSWTMPTLTRRRYPERPDCWHVYCGDIHVGTIAIRAGVPVDVDQWGWAVGFYPGTEPHQDSDGIAATFEQARASFEAAWGCALANPDGSRL